MRERFYWHNFVCEQSKGRSDHEFTSALSLSLSLSLSLCFHAHARDDWTPVSVRFDAEGWAFVPAVSEGQVLGFVAWLTDGGTGGNISVVWLHREQDGTWTTWAWESNSLAQAVGWVRSTWNDPSLFSHDPTIGRALLDVGIDALVDPSEVVNGLYFYDPLQPTVTISDNPAEVLDLLAASGWAAAPALSASAVEASPCDADEVAIETMLSRYSVEAVQLLSEQGTPLTECQWPCTCTTVYGASTCAPPCTWAISTRTYGGSVKCEYRRPATAPWTKTGLTRWRCNNCAASGTASGEDYGAEDVLVGDPCPAGPSSWTFIP